MASSSTMVWDYVVFVLFVVGSTVYPIWDEIRGRKEAVTKQNYVFATGRVSVFAIMMSIARGSLGVRTFIGFPSEQYYRGSAMWETIYGMASAYPLVCLLFLPVYFGLDITSVYQYLDMRFKSRLVRGLASAAFVLRNSFALGVTLYTPCVALNTIMEVPIYWSLLTLTGISICFTLFGGLKAAITADVIQGITIIAVSLLVIGQGLYDNGGVESVYKANMESGRFQFFHFSGDLTTRVDTLSAFVGQMFITLSILGCQQNLVQRYMSMKSEKEVRKTLFLNIPFVTVLFSLPWLVGAVVYATYANCDPRKLGLTEKMDEILPFYVFDRLLYIPGCVGIFLATLFNGALCISVSNLNSLATVTWEDFISQIPRYSKVSDRAQLLSIKALGIGYAFLVMGVAFSVGLLSGIIEMAMLTSSATSGPLVGVFILAMFVPVANWKGASIGMIISLITCVTLSIGFLTLDRNDVLLPTTTEGCTNDTFSPWIPNEQLFESTKDIWTTNAIDWNHPQSSADADAASVIRQKPEANSTGSVFALTYMYYSLLGTFLTVFIGTLVSWITHTNEDECDEKLLNPYLMKLLRFIRDRKFRRKTKAAQASIVANSA